MSLKPYWGNPAVRNYRGDGGNLTLDREGVTKLLVPSVVKAPSFYSTVILPGHGEFLKSGASRAVKDFAESMK